MPRNDVKKSGQPRCTTASLGLLIPIDDPVYFTEVVDGLTGGSAFRPTLAEGDAFASGSFPYDGAGAPNLTRIDLMVTVDRGLTGAVQGLREGYGNLIPRGFPTGINLANAVHQRLGKLRN
jgi:hypothetical protein